LDRSGSSRHLVNGTPGPGSYRLPSDFGYYEAKKIKRSTSGTKIHE